MDRTNINLGEVLKQGAMVNLQLRAMTKERDALKAQVHALTPKVDPSRGGIGKEPDTK